MRKKIILLVTAAFGMAFISPFVAFLGVQMSSSITIGSAFYTWFLTVPLAIHALEMPPSHLTIFALTLLGYFLQYLVLLGLVWASFPAARAISNFAFRIRPLPH